MARHTRANGWLESLAFPLVLLFASGAGAATSASQYSARTWQLEDGLPRNCVQAVVQTRDGYLWVGTQGGLARFDGVHFTVFDPSNVPQMQNANVVALAESRDGSLWIATGWGGLLQLKDGQFRHWGRKDGLASDAMLHNSIYQTHDGALWFATAHGLSRFQDGHFSTFAKTNGLSNDVVRGMCEDPEGNLWLATSAGVDCWKDGRITRRLNQRNGLPNSTVGAICYDGEGVVWIGAGDSLTCLRPGGQLDTFSSGNNASFDVITSLFADRHGTLWVGSEGGISRFVEGKFVPEVNAEGLRYDHVFTTFEDREENLWVASRDGLIRFHKKRFEVYGPQQGLSCNNVTSVLENQAGRVWIGTWGGGLNCLNQGTITGLRRAGRLPVKVLGLLEAASGELWVGADHGEGLFHFTPSATQWYATGDGLPGTALRVLHQDRAARLWVGTSAGLYRLEQDRFVNFGQAHGLGEPTVRALHEDRAGYLWVGTESGLWRLQGETVERFTAAQGLSQERVIAIHEDGQGTLWFGTGGAGLNRFHGGRFVAIDSRHGLSSDSVCEILEDDRGWFWMTCLRGIFRARRADLEAVADGRQSSVRSIVYGKTDGMWTEVCSSIAKPGAWKTKDGRLWFATLKGLCVIDPSAQADEDCLPPPVVLERVLADKRPFPAQETLPVSESIRVPPGRGELEFHYTALSFQVPERNRFKYRLQGFDHEWIDAGTRRVAFYNNLAPGTYRFQVLARNSDGAWNETGAAADIVLLPHFWQTWWFRLAIAGGVGLAFLGLHGVRLARFRELEALRLRIATDLHDEVGSNLSTLSLLSRKLLKDGTVAQEHTEDLLSLNRIAGQTSNAIREIVWLINPEYDTLQDLSLRMEVTAKTMLGELDCRFQCHLRDGALRLPPQRRQSLYLLFKETVTNVAKHAQASRVDITITQSAHAWEMVVQDNGLGFDPAVDHRGNGLKNLRLRAQRLKGYLELQSRPGGGTTVRFSMKLA